MTHAVVKVTKIPGTSEYVVKGVCAGRNAEATADAKHLDSVVRQAVKGYLEVCESVTVQRIGSSGKVTASKVYGTKSATKCAPTKRKAPAKKKAPTKRKAPKAKAKVAKKKVAKKVVKKPVAKKAKAKKVARKPKAKAAPKAKAPAKKKVAKKRKVAAPKDVTHLYPKAPSGTSIDSVAGPKKATPKKAAKKKAAPKAKVAKAKAAPKAKAKKAAKKGSPTSYQSKVAGMTYNDFVKKHAGANKLANGRPDMKAIGALWQKHKAKNA